MIMTVLGKLFVVASWILLLVAGLGMLVSGWLYYGYSNMDCHSMFAKPEATCSKLTAWASDHALMAGRSILPYRQVLTDERDLLILLAASGVVIALLVQVIHRIIRRRRRRRLGVFADISGFRPIEGEENPWYNP